MIETILGLAEERVLEGQMYGALRYVISDFHSENHVAIGSVLNHRIARVGFNPARAWNSCIRRSDCQKRSAGEHPDSRATSDAQRLRLVVT